MTAALREQAGRPHVLLRRRPEARACVHRGAGGVPGAGAGRAVAERRHAAGAGLRWSHGGAVAAAVGKVFFTLGGSDYVCSGVLVGGAHPDVVLTAAHCVTGGTASRGAQSGGRAAGRSGRPTGCSCPATATGGRRTASTPHAGSSSHPTGPERPTAASGTTSPSSRSPRLSRTPGPDGRARAPRERATPHGLPVAFASSQDAAPAARAYVFGYPALAPYSGLYPDYCAGARRRRRRQPADGVRHDRGRQRRSVARRVPPAVRHRHRRRGQHLQALRRPAAALRHGARPRGARTVPPRARRGISPLPSAGGVSPGR